ncbi:flavodoxin domain-containing protein [uncultured Roseibium sp.]|uniref:flavodoxin domain-containing protein n=1 Tax=uncultured Roseibium sp. TaxID=1936171 RepID=UPI00261C0BE1|nr:flavodoxin domain-containing protein [uncultured Roseibium sp.]
MNILIAYASTEGHTEKVAKHIGTRLSAGDHIVRYHNVRNVSGGLAVSDFDKTIIAGSVHSAQHQSDLELFTFANREQLNKMPTLFVSVSLAAAFPDTREEARGYINAFQKASSWQPSETVLVAGAVKPGNYDWFEKSALLEGDLAGHVNEELAQTREFTDWDALDATVSDFVKK